MAEYVIDTSLQFDKNLPSWITTRLRNGEVYTHQAVAATATVTGSNDGINFVAILTLNAGESESLMHSFRYLKVVSTGKYHLTRGN